MLFSEASLPSMLEIPTRPPPQPPTIRLQCEPLAGNVSPQKKVAAIKPLRFQLDFVVPFGDAAGPCDPGQR